MGNTCYADAYSLLEATAMWIPPELPEFMNYWDGLDLRELVRGVRMLTDLAEVWRKIRARRAAAKGPASPPASPPPP